MSQKSAQIVRKIVGKSVHWRALNRLIEQWPNAHVEVEHFRSRYDGVPLKVTEVHIYRTDEKIEDQGHVWAQAKCRLDCDRWERRRGIDLAFRRALRKVKAVQV